MDSHPDPGVLQWQIKSLLVKNEMKLKDLSAETGLSQSYLSDLVRGNRGTKRPSLATILSLSKAFGVAPEELMTVPPHIKGTFRKLPDVLEGVPKEHILSLLSNDPNTGEVLIKTLGKLAQLYSLREEDINHAMRRIYQQEHFKKLQKKDPSTPLRKIENAAREYLEKLSTFGWTPEQGIENHEILRDYIIKEWKFQIDETTLGQTEEFAKIKTVYLGGKKPRLLVNPNLTPEQRAMIWAREIGFFALGIVNKGTMIYPAPRRGSFEELMYAFQATYFASALLMPRETFMENLNAVFSAKTWNPEQFLSCGYGHRPGLFCHRITSVLSELGFDEYSFFRYAYNLQEQGAETKSGHVLTSTPRITDALNFTSFPDVQRLGAGEDRCRLWGGAQAIGKWIDRYGTDLDKNKDKLFVHVQKSLTTGLKYPKDKAPCFLVISVAYPSSGRLSAVSIALRMDADPAFEQKVAFLGDPQIEPAGGDAVEVALSCQRCANMTCAVRVGEPRILWSYEKRHRQEELLKNLEEKISKEVS